MIPAPLRYREFRSVFFAGLVSTFGDFFVPIAISFAVLDLTGSASDLGLVLFARILGQVLLFLAGGPCGLGPGGPPTAWAGPSPKEEGGGRWRIEGK